MRVLRIMLFGVAQVRMGASVGLVLLALSSCIRFHPETPVETEREFEGSRTFVSACIRSMNPDIVVRGDEPWRLTVHARGRSSGDSSTRTDEVDLSELVITYDEHQRCDSCVGLIRNTVLDGTTTDLYRRRGTDIRYLAVYGISLMPGVSSEMTRVKIIPVHFSIARDGEYDPNHREGRQRWNRATPGTHDQAVILEAVARQLERCRTPNAAPREDDGVGCE